MNPIKVISILYFPLVIYSKRRDPSSRHRMRSSSRRLGSSLHVFLALLLLLRLERAQGFFSTVSSGCDFSRHQQSFPRIPCCRRSLLLLSSGSASTTDKVVDQLLHLVNTNPQDDASIRKVVLGLEESEQEKQQQQQQQQQQPAGKETEKAGTDNTESDLSLLFQPLLGNYNVSCTLPSEPSERPVGGKWNNGRLFSIQKTWQHLIPANNNDDAQSINSSNNNDNEPMIVAQAVNVIVLDAFFHMWTIYVILRGNALALAAPERERIARERQTPGGCLSPRTVRANFDPPRIVFCRSSNVETKKKKTKKPFLALSLGPTSSVVLDTTFCDNLIRIGKGSKGSRFVFVRTTDPTADEWRELLQIKPIGKRQLTAFFGTFAMAGILGSWRLSGFGKWTSLCIAVLTLPLTLLIARSTGGIVEENQQNNNNTGQSA